MYEVLTSHILAASTEQEFVPLWTAFLALQPATRKIESIYLLSNLPTHRNSKMGRLIKQQCRLFLLIRGNEKQVKEIFVDEVADPLLDHESGAQTLIIKDAMERIEDYEIANAFASKPLHDQLLEWIQIRDKDGTLEDMVERKFRI